MKRTSDGSSDQTLSDIYLRNEFPPPGKARSTRSGDTPTDRYNNAIEALSKAFNDLDQCFEVLSKVVGDDDHPIVDERGVDLRMMDAWREILRRMDEETAIWARSFRKFYGTRTGATKQRIEDEENDEDLDPYPSDDGDPAERCGYERAAERQTHPIASEDGVRPRSRTPSRNGLGS